MLARARRKLEQKFFIIVRNIFLRVQMAAEKGGKRRIFSLFFRRFHYAYNILDGRHDCAKKGGKRKRKEVRRNLNLDLPLRSSLRILFRGLLQTKQLFSRARYNRAALRFMLKKCLLQWRVFEICRTSCRAIHEIYTLYRNNGKCSPLIKYRRHILAQSYSKFNTTICLTKFIAIRMIKYYYFPAFRSRYQKRNYY